MTDAGRSDSDDGFFTCERCGKVKPVSFVCACGGQGQGHGPGPGGPVIPEGWDPALTQTSRPRLRIVLGPETPENPKTSEQTAGEREAPR